MSLTLNLEKSTQSLKLSLEKVGIFKPPALDVGMAMDISGSFEDEHRDGSTNSLMTRLVPWGLLFDPDKKLDFMTFSDGPYNVSDVGPVTAENYLDFIKKRVVDKVQGWNGGTDYSYVLDQFLGTFGWNGPVIKKAGFIGRLFGQKDEVIEGEKKKSIVFMITDGANDANDVPRTLDLLKKSETRGDQIFFFFLGVSNQGGEFPFLKRLDESFTNCAYIPVKNLKSFIAQTDEDLNEVLLNEKLLKWFGES